MFKWFDLLLLLLLLLCFVHQRESIPVSVTGNRGGSITLSCDFDDREISDIVLSSLSNHILDCHNEECKSKTVRVFKEGSCDIIIKDLRLSDAGKYIQKVYYKNDQAEVERQILEYHLHIQDNISVKMGDKVKLDVLLISADKVQHQSNNNSVWTEVWSRRDGVSSDRLTDRDGNLTISNFTVSDTGTYRVLDSEGEIWITVTVTESKGKLENTDDDKIDDTEQHTVEYGIFHVGLPLFVLLGVLLFVPFLALIFAIINKYSCLTAYNMIPTNWIPMK